MKRILFSILLVIAGIFQTKAQSLLTDGKVWHCLDFEASSYDFNRDIYGTYTIRVVGDTIVGGIKCKQLEKVWREDPSTASRFAALEKDSRLYGVFDSDEWMLREQLNFGLKVGDSCFYQAKVIATDEIEVHGVKRKRITIDNHNKQPDDSNQNHRHRAKQRLVDELLQNQHHAANHLNRTDDKRDDFVNLPAHSRKAEKLLRNQIFRGIVGDNPRNAAHQQEHCKRKLQCRNTKTLRPHIVPLYLLAARAHPDVSRGLSPLLQRFSLSRFIYDTPH